MTAEAFTAGVSCDTPDVGTENQAGLISSTNQANQSSTISVT